LTSSSIAPFVLQTALASVPLAYGILTHRDLRSYGLRLTSKLLTQGVSLSIVVGASLSLVSSHPQLTAEWLLLSLIVAPVCEELFFRGFLQTHLTEKVGGGRRLSRLYLSYGLILAALFFGLSHLSDIFLLGLTLTAAVINATFAALLGLLIGYVYQESHSLLTPILMHSCLNAFSSLLP